MATGMRQDEEVRKLQTLVDELRAALAKIYLTPHVYTSDRDSVISMLRTARWALDRFDQFTKEKQK